MCETAPEMVRDRFGDPFWKISDKVQKCCQSCSKSGLENMKLDGFWVVMAPLGLGLAVVRGTGLKFHYRPLFGHIGPPGAPNRSFCCFCGHFRFLASPRPIVAYWPLGPRVLLGPRPYWAQDPKLIVEIFSGRASSFRCALL